MSIRAKFIIEAVEENINSSDGVKLAETVKGRPVYANKDGSVNEENKSFNMATPWGDLTLGINNPGAFGFFVQGQEYYLDFTPAAN